MPAAATTGDLTAVADLTSAVLSARPDAALDVAARGLQRLTAADVVVVTTPDGATQRVRAVAGPAAPGPRVGDTLPLHDTVAGAAVVSGQVQVCLDAETDPRASRHYSRRHRIRSSVMVPLVVEGVVHGLLCLLARTPGSFGSEDVDVVRVVAGAVAGRISQAVRTAEQETLLSTVFASLDEGIVVRSWPDAEVLLLNAAAERIIGLGARDLSGQAIRPGWQWRDEDGRPLDVADLPTSVVLRTGSAVRDRLLEVEDSCGARRWLELTALPVRDAADQVASVVTRVADVSERIRGRHALERSERRLAAATGVTGLAWWDYDVRADRHTWSDTMFALVGLPPGEPPGLEELLGLVHPDDRHLLEPGEGQAGTRVFRVVLPGGAVRFLQSWSDVVRDGDGAVLTIHGTTLDVTEREEAGRAVADSEEMFRAAFDEAPTGMALVSLAPERRGTVLRANASLELTLGEGPGALVGQHASTWLPSEDCDEVARRLDVLALSGSVEPRDLLMVRSDGDVVHAWVRSAVLPQGAGGEPCVLVHVLDVTEQRRVEASLEHLAMTDTLTGLANRARLVAQTGRALEALPEKPSGRGVAALLLDLDRFKLVNDGLGHPVGDDLLVEVARRLAEVAPAGACVARLGGDEFVVLLESVTREDAEAVARQVTSSLRAPYALPSGHRVITSCSVGIALAWTGDRTGSDLLREADLALYVSKDAGRDRVSVCDDDLRASAVARVDVENVLREALDGTGLMLHLQPVVELTSNQVVGAEALVRVRTREGVVLAPAAFVDVAEETGLIVRIDGWVVERAVAHLAGSDVPRLAVNVSGRTLQEPGFVERVVGALRRHGVDGARLEVEITESVLLEATWDARETLTALREAGVAVGLDDFGTGYSALAYLQRLPLDFLKIDRSFVVRLGRQDDAAEATVRAIVDLAHAHRLVVTAEGVETREQEHALRRLGCDKGQGFLYGRPALLVEPRRQPTA